MTEFKKPGGLLRSQPEKFLEERQICWMLGVLGRDLQGFRAAWNQLTPECFPDDMAYLAGLWRVLRKEYEKYNRLPTHEELCAELEAWLAEESFEERTLADLSRLVDDMYKYTEDYLTTRRSKALKYAKVFINEALQRNLKRELTAANPSLPKLMEDYHRKARSVQALDVADRDLAFPENLESVPVVQKDSTGCKFFDTYMNKGQAAGEVYGFGAPVGVCKTLIGIQLACERVTHSQGEAAQRGKLNAVKNGENPWIPVVYLVLYEEEIASVRSRALSFAAHVEKTIIEEGRWPDLSTRLKQNYKGYEQFHYPTEFAAWKAGGDPPLGERERIDEHRMKLTRNLRFVDFTGDRPEYADMAGSYVDGIVAYIERDQERLGAELDKLRPPGERTGKGPGVSMVVIDYAGACADRHCQHTGLDPSKNLRHLVGKMAMRCKNQIAVPMKCPVWLLHQSSTDANSRTPGQVPRITDTAEAHNFFENCNFGFLVGTKTNNSLAVLASVKQRREAKMAERIIKIDGLFCRVLDFDDKWRLDNSKIVEKSEFRSVVSPEDELNDEGYQSESDYEGGASAGGFLPGTDPDILGA